MVHVANFSDDEQSDGEVCELCPICGNQAYGKVVQCGECGDWYYYVCININDNTIDTLGEDDFVCRVCTDELLYVGTVNLQTQENDLSIQSENKKSAPEKTCLKEIYQ